jgi:hypothetical protein
MYIAVALSVALSCLALVAQGDVVIFVVSELASPSIVPTVFEKGETPCKKYRKRSAKSGY